MSSIQEQSRSSLRFPVDKAIALLRFFLAYVGAYALLFAMGNTLVGLIAFSLWFPAAGLRVAVLYSKGARVAPLLAVGEVAAQILVNGAGVWGWDNLHWMVMGISAPPLMYGAILWLWSCFSECHKPTEPRGMPFLVTMALCVPAVTAPASTLIQELAGAHDPAMFWEASLSFWVGDAIGILMFAPLVVFLLDHGGRLLPLVLSKAGFLFEAILVNGLGILLLVVSGATTDIVRWYLAFIPLLWMSLRHGMAGAISAVFAVNLASAWVQQLEAASGARLELQLFLIVFSIIGLVVGALVTARQQASHELLGHMQRLAHHDRMDALNAISAGLAHEIAQPLGAISSYSGVAQDKDCNEAALRASLTDIRHEADRMAQIIERMRALSQDKAVKPEVFNLEEAISEILPLIQATMRRRSIRCSMKIGDGAPLAYADLVQTQQVILNLLRNSMEAVEPVQGGEKRIAVCVAREARNLLKVTVEDNGSGVPHDRLQSLFHPFGSTKADGMGVGLAISKKLIELQGGSMWARAARTGASGLAVEFTLPRAKSEA